MNIGNNYFLAAFIMTCTSCTTNLEHNAGDGERGLNTENSQRVVSSKAEILRRLKLGLTSESGLLKRSGTEKLRFDDDEPFVFSKAEIARSLTLGFTPNLELLEKKGNIYLKLTFCNRGESEIIFRENNLDYSALLRAKVEFNLGGRKLGDRVIIGHNYRKEIIPEISVGVNKCHEKVYNVTSGFGVYNVKGRYSALFRSGLAVEHSDKQQGMLKEIIKIQSNVATLVVE